MPLGSTTQNSAFVHLNLDMLFSLRDCNLHDTRRFCCGYRKKKYRRIAAAPHTFSLRFLLYY